MKREKNRKQEDLLIFHVCGLSKSNENLTGPVMSPAGGGLVLGRKSQHHPGGGRVPLHLDRIKREKGVWWMPWRQEAMKDVALCDKSRGGESTL